MGGTREPCIVAKDLTMAFGSFVLQRDLNFTVNRGDIFIIMAGAAAEEHPAAAPGRPADPAKGQVLYGDVDFWGLEPEERERFMRRFGILYQSGALWSSMTLAQNVALRWRSTPTWTRRASGSACRSSWLWLAFGFEEYYPSEISGG